MTEKKTEKKAGIEAVIGYKFKNKSHLKTALTHSSYANEQKVKIKYNERLEFLGDSILSLVVSNYIFNNYKKLPEGELSKLRASIVCEKSLAGFARQIELGQELLIGKGESACGGHDRDSILADAFEALIAAIYQDSSLAEVENFLIPFIEPASKLVVTKKSFSDYKTDLQEIVQRNKDELLFYKLVGETGPDHEKIFISEVYLNSNPIGRGEGKSKKEAEQQAAKSALALMGK